MKYVSVGKWRCRCDPETTRQAYASFEERRAEMCGCCYCRNFVAARERVYSVAVRALFERLGIDFTKEAEVYELTRLTSGLHLYGGWFHFVSRIEEETDDPENHDSVEGPFNIRLHDKPALVPSSFQGMSLLQLEFTARVPWVLHEPEPE